MGRMFFQEFVDNSVPSFGNGATGENLLSRKVLEQVGESLMEEVGLILGYFMEEDTSPGEVVAVSGSRQFIEDKFP